MLPMLTVPDALVAAGLSVFVVPEWRSNGHDGQLVLADPWGVLLHHTADNGGLKSVWGSPDIRPDVPQPRANLWMPRDNSRYDVAVVSAGRAYHAGRNSSVALADVRAGRVGPSTPDARVRGLADDTNGNGVLVGLEVENWGDGQPLTDSQLRNLPRVCAVLLGVFGLGVGHLAHHRQVTERKPDMQWRGDIWAMTATVLAGKEGVLMALTDEQQDVVYRAAQQILGAVGYGQRDFAGTVEATLGVVQGLVNTLNTKAGALATAITDSKAAVLGAVAAVPTDHLSKDERALLASDIAALLDEHGVPVDSGALLDALAQRLTRSAA